MEHQKCLQNFGVELNAERLCRGLEACLAGDKLVDIRMDQ